MHLIFSEQSKSSAQFSAVFLSIFCLEKATDTRILIVFWSYRLVCPCERGAIQSRNSYLNVGICWCQSQWFRRHSPSSKSSKWAICWQQRKVIRNIPSISKCTALLPRVHHFHIIYLAIPHRAVRHHYISSSTDWVFRTEWNYLVTDVFS